MELPEDNPWFDDFSLSFELELTVADVVTLATLGLLFVEGKRSPWLLKSD